MDIKSFEAYVAAAELGGWDVSPVQEGPYPFFDAKTSDLSLAFALYARVSKGAESHTVVAAVRQNDGKLDYSVWCSDKFIDAAGISLEDAEKRCSEVVKQSGAPASVGTELLSLHGRMPASDSCNFWLNWRRSQTLCEHTRAFLAQLQSTNPNFSTKMAEQLEQAQTTSKPGLAPLSDTLSLAELAFRVPVLIEGDRGAGKTVEARAFARDNGYARVELGGHEGTEALDLLGYSLLAPSGAMVWKDGALTEAFRRAKTDKVVLIVDEILRIRVRELSIFLTSLSPDNGVYRIRTGRIVDVVDGVAREEELECPCENLCIIATTNVGAEYSVDEIDPALAERFVVLRKDTTEEALKRILHEEAKARGFKTSLATQLVKFYVKMVEARNRGLVARTPTTRTLVRAIAIARTEADVLRVLRTQILLWVARTSEGLPVPEQIKTAEALLDRFAK